MRLLAPLVHLLYPPACLVCRHPLAPGSEAAALCPGCALEARRCLPPLCRRCGLPLAGAFDAVMSCRDCRQNPPAFECARAPWQYTGAIRLGLQGLKYHHRHRIGRWLADEMAQLARTLDWPQQVDLVVPVPLHWVKHRLRGADTPAALARRVAAALQLPYAPQGLRRVRWTRTQTRLGLSQRRRNVADAFQAKSSLVQGRRILLVDDVLTSAATAQACSRALQDAGAAAVQVLTAARTPAARGRA